MDNILKKIFTENNVNSKYNSEWVHSLNIEATRIQEFMILCAISIFPVFAFFDFYTIPSDRYWPVTALRIAITVIIAAGLYFQRKYKLNYHYLSYVAFLSISFFCCYATVMGGKTYLYQHNAATCTVFLAASLFFFWHWIHSFIVVISTVIFYTSIIFILNIVSLSDVMLEGGSMLITIMILFPFIVAYRYVSFRNEFYLRKELEESNVALQEQKNEAERKNVELVVARASLHTANEELQNMNSKLERLVKERTVSLEETNAELKNILGELDMFLYCSYHDLKGPVARLLGLANLAKKEVSENVAHFYVDKFIDNIREMEILMSKLNKVNNINMKEPVKEELNLDKIIKEVSDKYKLQLAYIKFNYQSNVKSVAVSDSSLLIFIIERLLENSLQYRKSTEDDILNITISVIKENVRISVYDNGVGISEKVIPDVFKMFFRGNETSKGHGLGLYIAKKATEKLKGSIKALSVEGKFSEFIVMVPNHV